MIIISKACTLKFPKTSCPTVNYRELTKIKLSMISVRANVLSGLAVGYPHNGTSQGGIHGTLTLVILET